MSDNLKDTVVDEGPLDDGVELGPDDPVVFDPVVEVGPALLA
jgi:hypothetical protein